MPNDLNISLPPGAASSELLSGVNPDLAGSGLTDDQRRNKALIEEHLRRSFGGVSEVGGDLSSLGEELGLKDGDEVDLDSLDLTDQEVLDAVLEASLVDLLREVNNSAWVLSQSCEQLKESSKRVRDLAGALWTISVEEVAKVAGAYRMIRTAPEGREDDWKVELTGRHREALGLVDQFWSALSELEDFRRAGREKRRLGSLVTAFLGNMHKLMVASDPGGQVVRMECRAQFSAAVERSRPHVRVHAGRAVPGGSA
jgi:hypothetical protein